MKKRFIKIYGVRFGLDEIEKNLDERFKIKFYCFGSDLNAIKKYAIKNPRTFHNHGKVEKNLADEAITGSDILISIGDVEGMQISSKIFDYLSMGKPILHFAYTQECVNTRLLAQYPLAHTVMLNKDDCYSESTIKNAALFVKKVNGKSMSFAMIAKLYPNALPETTAHSFRDCINRNCIIK